MNRILEYFLNKDSLEYREIGDTIELLSRNYTVELSKDEIEDIEVSKNSLEITATDSKVFVEGCSMTVLR